MKTVVFFLLLLLPFSSAAQSNEDRLFEASKGHWRLPLARVTEVVGNERLKRAVADLSDSVLRLKSDMPGAVRAVHAGTVALVAPTLQTILVQYGDYFVIYSNLDSFRFQKGAIVRAGDVLGVLTTERMQGGDEAPLVKEYVLWLTLIRKKGEVLQELSAREWVDWTAKPGGECPVSILTTCGESLVKNPGHL